MKTVSQLHTEVFHGPSEGVRGTRLGDNPLNGHNKSQPVGSGCDSPGSEVTEIDDNRRCSVVRVGPWLGACSPARKTSVCTQKPRFGTVAHYAQCFCMFRNVRGGFENPIEVFSHFVLFRVSASLVVCRVALIRPDVGLDGLLQAVQILLEKLVDTFPGDKVANCRRWESTSKDSMPNSRQRVSDTIEGWAISNRFRLVGSEC